MNGLFEFEFGLIFWQTIILLITFTILGKYAWKPILKFIHQQEKAYEEAAQKAEEQLERSHSLLRDNELMLKNMHEKKKGILEEALTIKKNLLATARQEASKVKESMVMQAQEDILREKQATIKALKKQVGMLSVQIAEKLIQRELSDKNKQEVLLNRLIIESSTSNTISSTTTH